MLLLQVGHKFGAPKGVAALYIRDGVHIERFLKGGGQVGRAFHSSIHSFADSLQ